MARAHSAHPIYIYPFASMGAQAYYAGMYSIKHFPRTFPFKKTSPSSSLFSSQFFLDITWISLLFDIAQQICSCSIFSCVNLTSSTIHSLQFEAIINLTIHYNKQLLLKLHRLPLLSML